MKAMTSRNTAKLSINGILLLNKPCGVSSNHILQKIRRLFQAKKAGHCGTLDPLATGMLPVCFGEAAKFSQYMLDADKCYLTTALLGEKTSTGDSEGTVIQKITEFDIRVETVMNAIHQYTGTIQQIPSMFSALKHQGVPLYQLARKGIEIERKARSVQIYSIKLLRFDGRSMDLEVSCSKGTYIRNLVEDIGDHLGVGAHVTRLHRKYTSGFDNQRMYSPEELESLDDTQRGQCLLPVEEPLMHVPALYLSEYETMAIRQGKMINNPDWVEKPGPYRIYNASQHFLGLGEMDMFKNLKSKRLLAVTED